MKRFFYFSVSILCLALVALMGFHVGNQTAEAQDSGLSIVSIEGYTGNEHLLFLSNGDIYHANTVEEGISLRSYCGNLFDGSSPAGLPVISTKVWASGLYLAVLSNGDVYYSYVNDSILGDHGYIGNFFGENPPVNASESTWGNIKNQLRK